MKKKSHKRMQRGGMAKMDDAAGRAMIKNLRGSRAAPSTMEAPMQRPVSRAMPMTPAGEAMPRGVGATRIGRGGRGGGLKAEAVPAKANFMPMQRVAPPVDFASTSADISSVRPAAIGGKQMAPPVDMAPTSADIGSVRPAVIGGKQMAPTSEYVGSARPATIGGKELAAPPVGMKRGGAVKANSKKMRGGGLARKGVGMALAKGGMVKANGCAKRGKTRGKMV